MTAPARELVEVAAGVFVATSRRYTTTSTVVVRGDEAALIDPSWTPDELAGLAAWLRDRGLVVVGGLATHAHHDHVLWHPDFGPAPRWSSAATARAVAEHHDVLWAALGEEFAAWPCRLDGLQPFDPDEGPALFPRARPPVVAVHEGHAPGHTAVLFEDHGVLVAGDMLSDVELPLPYAADNVERYAAGLDALAPLVGRARVLIPGHGHPTGRPLDRLDADRRYLAAVMAGRDPDDARRVDPEMEETHQALVRAWAERS